MPVPLIPIARPVFGPEEEAAVAEVLRSGWVTQGPRVAEFEQAIADRVGAPHAIAMSSCTTALHATLVALGIGPGDEVVCPALSFIATANSIVHAGARPVFADVDERTFNLSPEAVAGAIGSRTRAILTVHQVGLPCDLDELQKIARDRGVVLIEDAACALGSTYRGAWIGKPHGVAACFSFHPRKILSCGEGGMVTTADPELATRLRRLRQHGMTLSDLQRHGSGQRYRRESYVEAGFNYRMTDIQGAIGLIQVQRLEELLSRRRMLAAHYDGLLAGVPGLELPFAPSDREPNFQSYVVRLRGGGGLARDRAIDALLAAGISTRPGLMYIPREAPYAPGAASPRASTLADESLALPLFHELSIPELERVASVLRGWLEAQRK